MVKIRPEIRRKLTNRAKSSWIALIPAYEPDSFLTQVAQEACHAGFSLVVVDDGSGSAYQHIFANVELFGTVLKHAVNQGKGAALKTGLRYIREHFQTNYLVVTLDADGQHRISDAVRVCLDVQEHPGSLILGSRKLDKNVPLRSQFGNTVTRFVYRLATGISVHDTQTGLRAFDSSLVPFLLTIQGERYEYEMNVLLECTRQNIPMREVEVATIYLGNNQASHFNSIKDSFRVYKEILKFSASSFIGFLVDYGLYSLLLWLTQGVDTTISLPLSNVLARVVSASVNYTLNRKVVFQSNANPTKSATEYFALAALILAGNTALLSLLVETLGMNHYLAKILTEMVFFTLSWVVQRFFIFKNRRLANS